MKKRELIMHGIVSVVAGGGPFNTGVPDLDSVLSNGWSLATGIVAAVGVIWFLISLAMLGFAIGDENPHQKKSAIKSVIGSVILIAAGSIATALLAGTSAGG